jgi:cytochrome P450
VAAFLGPKNVQPMVVAGVEMPARTRLFLLNWPAQIGPHHFADTLRLKPTRWSAARGRGEARNSRAYLRFGAWPRVCARAVIWSAWNRVWCCRCRCATSKSSWCATRPR